MNFMNLTQILYLFVDMDNLGSLRSMLERNPLSSDGANYSSWLLMLKNVLRREGLKNTLTTPFSITDWPKE